MKKILIIGGAGFIGSNFIRYILKKHSNVNVLNYDAITYSGNLDNLKDIKNNKRYRFVKGDVVDKNKFNKVFKSFKPDYIINFAAETHVDKSIHVGAKEFINTNILGVFNILEAIKNGFMVKKYVQVSTDEVYGSLTLSSKNKFKEDTAFAPNVPYAATKASGDMLCRRNLKLFNIPVIIAYGPSI